MWLCRQLEGEKKKEVRELIKLPKKIQDMKKILGKGTGGAYRPAYRELIRRHKGYHRQNECVEIGREKAINLVEEVGKELEQQGSPPQPSSYSQGLSTQEGKGKLESQREGSDKLKEI